MTTYARLSKVLAKRTYQLDEDCSFRREVVDLGIIDRLFNVFLRCPRCKGKITKRVVGIETNNYVGISRITQWYGECCVKCGIVLDNHGD